MLFVVVALLVAAAMATPVAMENLGPDTLAFNEAISFALLHYNFASGCQIQNILAWNCTYCVDKTFHVIGGSVDAATEVQYYAGFSGKTAIVGFRGSQTIENYKQDLEVDLVEYPDILGAQVHKGFLNIWTAIRANVVHLVTTALLTGGCNSIVLVGHSLGGAVATIAGLETAALMASLGIPVSVQTTGSPRVGNFIFSQAFNALVKNNQRMVHAKDLVPHLPLRLMGYHHVGTEVWNNEVNGAQTYKVCAPGGEDYTCSDSVLPSEWDLADHMSAMGLAKVDC